jgi:hypothetical protein
MQVKSIWGIIMSKFIFYVGGLVFFLSNSVIANQELSYKEKIPNQLRNFADLTSVNYVAKEKYFSAYYQGAFEYLAYKKIVEEEIIFYKSTCFADRDRDDLKSHYCGYYDGVISAKNYEGKLTLEDFGYKKVKLVGIVKFKDKKPFYFISDKKKIFLDYDSFVLKQVKPFGCYSLEGYLGDEGGYGTRIDVFKYHLLVDGASKEKKSTCKKR